MFDTYHAARQLGTRFNWKHGEYIAVLHVPNDAPIVATGPDHKGHWLLYDAAGDMLLDDGTTRLLGRIIRILHGPTAEGGS